MIIWNPWHGCHKISEGCEHCYMYFLDRKRGIDTSKVYRTESFYMPLQKKRDGSHKYPSGMEMYVGLSTDFFVQEADAFIGRLDASAYLATGEIEEVLCGGENYDGARPCHYEWVKSLSDQCRKQNVTFDFIETGSYFVKDGKTYHIPNKQLQSKQAYLSGLSFQGKPIDYKLRLPEGNLFGQEIQKPKPFFREHCQTCGSRMCCNGCSNCGACEKGNK